VIGSLEALKDLVNGAAGTEVVDSTVSRGDRSGLVGHASSAAR